MGWMKLGFDDRAVSFVFAKFPAFLYDFIPFS